MDQVHAGNRSTLDEMCRSVDRENDANAYHKCVGRWFMNVDEWNPSTEEWAFALQQIPPPEREKVMRYVFETDRKLALGSRLLQRFCVRSVLGLEDDEYEIARTKENKPYLKMEAGSMARSKLDRMGINNFTFNVSHHGSIVALACEPDCVVGLDVVKETERPLGGFTTEKYFESFDDIFTQEEWLTIRSGRTEDEHFQEFYRHWSMKEAYIKAHGFGLGVDLQTLSFGYTDNNETEQHVARARVLVNGTEPKNPWSFTMIRIDSDHVATVCRAPPQDCHSTFASCLTKGSLTSAEMKKSNSRAQPSFERVGLSDLVSTKKLEVLNKIRHPNHVLQQLSRDRMDAETSEFRRRWLKWLYSSSHIPSIHFTSNPSVYSLPVIMRGEHKESLSSLIRNLSPCSNAVLVVTGGIASGLDELEEALCLLKMKFTEVFFTVGTSELLLNEEEQGRSLSSLGKLVDVLERCDRIGVRTRPCALEIGEETDLTVVPLFSIPDYSCNDSALEEQIDSIQLSGAGSSCSWPVSLGLAAEGNLSSGTSVSRALAELNVEVQRQLNSPRLEEERLSIANGAGGKVRPSKPSNRARKKEVVLSFSHLDVKRSRHLCTQVQNLSPDIHVFGDNACEEGCFTDGKTHHVRPANADIVFDSTAAPSLGRLERVWPPSNNEVSHWTDFAPLSSLKSAVEKLL